jgi:long-chain fatty acid transport protein
MFKLKSVTRLATAVALAGGASLVQANGYHFLHQSVEGFSTAYASNGTGIEDISAMFSNPASITRFDGFNISTGLALDFPRSDFDNLSATSYTGALVTGTPVAPSQPIDTAVGGASYASYQFNDKVYLGLSVTAPFAYVSEYPDTAASRYHATLTKLYAYNLGTVFAYKMSDKLSLAAGLNLQIYQNDVNTMVPTTPDAPSPATDVESRIRGSDPSVGFTLGLEYQFNADTRFGMSYRSEIAHDFKGNADFQGSAENLQTLQQALGLVSLEGSAEFSIDTPSMLQFGLAHKLNDKWELYGNANYFGWSAFKDTHIRFSSGFPDVVVDNDWDNSWWLAVGGAYQLNDKVKLRAGIAYDWSPTPAAAVSPRAPNNDRMYAGFGMTYRPNADWKFDAGYLFILFEQAHVRLAGGNNAPRGTLSGDLDLYANVFMFQVSKTFR